MLPPLLNVRSSLLVVWSAVEKKRKKKRGEKRRKSLGSNRESALGAGRTYTTTLFVAGPGVPTRGNNSERASLVIRLLGAWHWPPNPPLLVRIDRETYFSSRALHLVYLMRRLGCRGDVVQHD